jgi:hypothetical protein
MDDKLKGFGRRMTIDVPHQHFPKKPEENQERDRTGQPAFLSRFEIITSGIRIQSAAVTSLR